MSESIVKELLAENEELRKQLGDQTMSYAFQIISLEKPVTIRGILIAEGVWKGIKYSYEEMKKILSKFEGLPLKVDHGHTKDFGLSDVGVLSKVEADDLLRAIAFEAQVTDEKAIPLVVSKQLDAVSIKGEFKNVDTSVSPPLGQDYSPIEFSLTSSPACEFCQIFNYELCKDKKDLNMVLPPSNIQGELNMSTPNQEEEIYIAEDDIFVSPEITEDNGEADFELVKQSSFEELAKKGKVGYTVPPGYYPKKVKRAMKKGKDVAPKYPYYKYEKYGKAKLSEEDPLDILELAPDYRTFMKDCMKAGKDMKACAAEYKAKGKPKEEEQSVPIDEFEEPPELAEYKCPACDFTGKSLDEFKKHWKDKHADSYGQYKHAKKLMKKLAQDKELRNHVRKVFQLSEEEPEQKPKEVPPIETKIPITAQSAAELVLGKIPKKEEK